ncbi:MAG: Smr/MutS family protein [Proteobacteria bacterium]|nr:Smr/MutS family protein [Pseudomonadota bacterium]
MKDSELWRYVTRNVTPYRPQRHPTPEPAATSREEMRAAPKAEPDYFAPSPPPAKRAPAPLKLGAVAAMDKRTGQRFKRGDMTVDGRIDLHGMTVEQAHGALTGFIRRSHARGARCVVVVTGKGERGGGKIRRETPEWLNRPDLRPLILAVTEARPQHGGAGALYVLLKRTRE